MKRTLLHQITDTHVPVDEGRLAAYFTDLSAGRLGPLPDLIIHTGDLVEGAETEEELRGQLHHAKSILDRSPVPVQCICHSHDRFGEEGFNRGRAFRDIIGQEFIQHIQLEMADLFLVSGSITCHPPFQAGPNPPEPPSWGNDLFDPAVLEEVERFLQRGSRPHRLLFYHHPLVPGTTPEQEVDDRQRQKLMTYCIGEEGRGRILPILRKHGIRNVFSGHVHIASRQIHDGIRFHTAPSMKSPPFGFRTIQLTSDRISSSPVWT